MVDDPADQLQHGRIERVVQGSDGGATLLTSIVSLDPIYIYFDMDEATYLKNNRLYFEGKRPSSRENPNPVQVSLAGETKPSHTGAMNFLDNRLDLSTGTLRGRAVIPNKDFSILPGQFGRVRLIGSSPYEALLLPDSAIATTMSWFHSASPRTCRTSTTRRTSVCSSGCRGLLVYEQR